MSQMSVAVWLKLPIIFYDIYSLLEVHCLLEDRAIFSRGNKESVGTVSESSKFGHLGGCTN